MFQSLTPEGPVSQLIDMGGPVMAVLMVMALAGIVTFVYLMLFGVLFAPRYTSRLRQSVHKWKQAPEPGVTDSLRANTRGLSGLNPLNQLVLATMEGKLRNAPSEQIRESVSGKAQGALTPFEAPLKIIEVIAALAPLLGLLGTVMGMMEAFSTMAAAEGRASASQLSGGIYQALTTTAAGLIVAIPFAALAAWIEFRLRRLQGMLNAVLADVLCVERPSIHADSAAGKPAVNRPSTDGRQPAAKDPASQIDWQNHQTLANAVR
ncbi:MotA/TolQ/ExbB proton channel family protein [Marinobacter confluentis]|uniref:MotA/TolQ/ExbB proton channel family protein n=1 Tax=Marinobacter confluentis TaxID=1697557 RepID=A0A4Z1C077_9GAMM|nr:MotA/TolQ/ExbB proton channel family protein [Marinobacter confluentis]TGN39343.1 MotA/TolQ/ExbB proton channel family protein [Marinobacter confluentis]